jgi:hypothetical protein
MDLIIKTAGDLTLAERQAQNIVGIPLAWPIESYVYTGGEIPSGFTVVTSVELDNIRATNQTAYDAWYASTIIIPVVIPAFTKVSSATNASTSFVSIMEREINSWSVGTSYFISFSCTHTLNKNTAQLALFVNGVALDGTERKLTTTTYNVQTQTKYTVPDNDASITLGLPIIVDARIKTSSSTVSATILDRSLVIFPIRG